jgi:hypothetical protein
MRAPTSGPGRLIPDRRRDSRRGSRLAHAVVAGLPNGINLADLTLDDSSLSGGSLSVSGAFTWTEDRGQNMLAAPLKVDGSAGISAAGKKIVLEPMTFDGDTEIAGSGLLETEFAGGAITNSGTFTLEPGASVQANAC